MDQPLTVPDLTPKQRAVAVAQQGRQKVERGRILVHQAGDGPCQHTARDLHLLVPVLLPGGELRGFRRHQHRGETRPRRTSETLSHFRLHGLDVDVPYDDHHQVIGDVARTIISRQIFTRNHRENILMANDRLPVGMLAERHRKQGVPEAVIGVVSRHRDLAQDDVALLGHLIRRQGRVQRRVGEDVDRQAYALAREIDVINGAIEGGVGVDVAPGALHGGADVAPRTPRGPLEEHVLEKV